MSYQQFFPKPNSPCVAMYRSRIQYVFPKPKQVILSPKPKRITCLEILQCISAHKGRLPCVQVCKRFQRVCESSNISQVIMRMDWACSWSPNLAFWHTVYMYRVLYVGLFKVKLDNFFGLTLSLWCIAWLNSVIMVEKRHHSLLNWSPISLFVPGYCLCH